MPDDPQPTDPGPATPSVPSPAGEGALPTPQGAPEEPPLPTPQGAPGEPPPTPQGAPGEPPLPTPEELADAPDATVRHAPKFGAFIAAGAIVGFLLGLLLTALVSPRVPLASDGSGFLPFLDGESAVRTVMAVAGAVLGGFVGGLCAVVADRRSVRRAGRDDA